MIQVRADGRQEHDLARSPARPLAASRCRLLRTQRLSRRYDPKGGCGRSFGPCGCDVVAAHREPRRIRLHRPLRQHRCIGQATIGGQPKQSDSIAVGNEGRHATVAGAGQGHGVIGTESTITERDVRRGGLAPCDACRAHESILKSGFRRPGNCKVIADTANAGPASGGCQNRSLGLLHRRVDTLMTTEVPSRHTAAELELSAAATCSEPPGLGAPIRSQQPLVKTPVAEYRPANRMRWLPVAAKPLSTTTQSQVATKRQRGPALSVVRRTPTWTGDSRSEARAPAAFKWPRKVNEPPRPPSVCAVAKSPLR